jgi:hypothetical protein
MFSPHSDVDETKAIQAELEKREEQNDLFLDEETVGRGAGSLNPRANSMSEVATFGNMVRPHNKLITSNGVEIMITGKERIEGAAGINTKYLNNSNLALDTYIVPGKSTTDIGLLVNVGEFCEMNRDIISLGVDLRSRTTWGKPQEVAKTTEAMLTDGNLSYGAHKHTIGIPLLYVRGIDFTLDLTHFYNKKSSPSDSLQKLKLGFFPVEIGRGISLGAAYLISPDVLSYAPVDVIQEFAPGILLSGDIIKNTLNYRLYLGIIKNLSGSNADLTAKTRSSQYNSNLFPYRGSGVLNTVSAFQVDWKCFSRDNKKVVFSPYLIFAHEGAGKVVLPEDSVSNIFTYGFEFAGEEKDNWDFSFEFAKNSGSQLIFGIDTNTLKREQRVSTITGLVGNNANTAGEVIVNTGVTFEGYTEGSSVNTPYSLTTDIIGKGATFLGESSQRQKKINSIYKGSSSNGKTILFFDENYTLKNADNRFRDPYTNTLNGFMAVFDIGKYITIKGEKIKWAFALGYASGDDNPNKPLQTKNDHICDSTYGGYIGIQEIYSGKMVRSAYLLNGAGQQPRVGSIPALVTDENGKKLIGSVEYPSQISGFNNLIYAGTSIHFIHSGEQFNWKWYPNILVYGQPNARTIYNENIREELKKDQLDPFLGTEYNLFLEIISKEIEGFKIFFTTSVFLPGAYYNDLKSIALNQEQEEFLQKVKYYGHAHNHPLVPTTHTDPAYYINLGIEFKF